MKPLTLLSLIFTSFSFQAFAFDASSIAKLRITIDYNQNPSEESLQSLQEAILKLNPESTLLNNNGVLNKKEIIIDFSIIQKKEVENFIKNLNDIMGAESKASSVTLESMKKGTQDWTK